MFFQVSLVVNVASECGFTEEHYTHLQQLQRDFGPYHFNVLAFPCNQFGQQEPGSDKEIDGFVRRVYGVSFPLFSKIAVVGTGANNVYKFLVGEKQFHFCWHDIVMISQTQNSTTCDGASLKRKKWTKLKAHCRIISVVFAQILKLQMQIHH